MWALVKPKMKYFVSYAMAGVPKGPVAIDGNLSLEEVVRTQQAETPRPESMVWKPPSQCNTLNDRVIPNYLLGSCQKVGIW
jgi:hypothetical protein